MLSVLEKLGQSIDLLGFSFCPKSETEMVKTSLKSFFRSQGRPTKKDRRDMDDFVDADIPSSMSEDDWDLFFTDDVEQSE